MDSSMLSSRQSRRGFLKNSIIAGTLSYLEYKGLFALSALKERIRKSPDIFYKYKTMSVAHFKELQEDIDGLRNKGKLSRHKIYRSYIDELKFEIPDNFPTAKSIVIISKFTRLMYVNFHLNGKTYEVMIPPQYYSDGISSEDLTEIIHKEIIKKPGYRVERADKVHLKLLAVRSGLGKYGRNNLCFVDGMGNFITLVAFFTDFEFEEDHWQELALLDACRNCVICYGICPTNCITKENFVINVGRCITLFNEVKGKFPRWILPSMHNALVGCMKCQLRCPENEGFAGLSGRLEDVTEDETLKILQGKPDEGLLNSLSRKLKKFVPASSKEYFPIFTRNLRALIRPGLSTIKNSDF